MMRLRNWLRWALGTGVIMLVGACATTPQLPPLAPPAVEVLVPVSVPCKVAEVPVSEKPRASSDMGIYDLAKTAMAERQLRIAEVERLRAASAGACPGGVK